MSASPSAQLTALPPWCAVLLDASKSRVVQPARSWADRLHAEFLPVLSRSLEYSDDPTSRLSRDSAFLRSLSEAKEFGRNDGPGILVADVTGLRDEQVNRLRNALADTGIPVVRHALTGTPSDYLLPAIRMATAIDRRHLGPSMHETAQSIDVVGDVHGCTEELRDLLNELGWRHDEHGWTSLGRMLVFVGDLIDRGPDPVGTMRLAMELAATGQVLFVSGNHDLHLRRFLAGEKVPSTHGMGETQLVMADVDPDERAAMLAFLDAMPHQLVLDRGRLLVAHAGCPERWQGVDSPKAIKECVFGTMLERAADGTPVRDDWADRYRGTATVVQGHVPLVSPDIRNEVVNIDTGCAFGNALTALRWPERFFVNVPARRDYTNGHPTALRLSEERQALMGNAFCR